MQQAATGEAAGAHVGSAALVLSCRGSGRRRRRPEALRTARGRKQPSDRCRRRPPPSAPHGPGRPVLGPGHGRVPSAVATGRAWACACRRMRE
ncbi:hypothetical protein CDD83_8923 [Cordyceps sp. RAO-2017]|nr:hypothetical protein CDD83_8923 [Cordyceps sp. RAO-2017]